MKKSYAFAILGMCFFCLSHLSLSAQTQTQAASKLYKSSAVIEATVVKIPFEITNPGFVELQLFNADKERIWIKGKVVNRVGKSYIAIPRKPLKPNQRYEYILKYKGKDYPSSFYAS